MQAKLLVRESLRTFNRHVPIDLVVVYQGKA